MSAEAVQVPHARTAPGPAREPVRLVDAQRDRQRATPLLEAVRDHDALAFHCPGHKQGRGAARDLLDLVGERVLAADVWLETGAYDRARRAAEELAADAWGASRSFLLGNGSTSGNLAFLLAHLRDGDPVVVSRTLHTSTSTGLVLTGARPVYVQPRADGVHPDDVAAALRATPGTRLVSVVSPAYDGVCSDTAGVVAAAHRHGALAYVDEAWGPHLPFHPDLPRHAMAVGADGSVTSVHKLLTAMSSGSLLHVGAAVDADRLDAVVRSTQTTSPLLPLLASVDAARRDLGVDGRARVQRALELAATARRGLAGLAGLTVGEGLESGDGPVGNDPLKLVVDVTGLGLSGFAVERLLRRDCALAPEGADLTRVFLVLGLGDDTGSVVRLVSAFDRLVGLVGGPDPRRATRLRARARLLSQPPPPGPGELTPRQAFLARNRTVPLSSAVGEVCAELLTPYPPGVPVVAPGEVLTAAAAAHLHAAVAAGAHVHGSADPTLRTVRVVEAG